MLMFSRVLGEKEQNKSLSTNEVELTDLDLMAVHGAHGQDRDRDDWRDRDQDRDDWGHGRWHHRDRDCDDWGHGRWR